MKKVLFCRSNPIDPDPRVEKEAEALANYGHQVQIVAWDRTAALPTTEHREKYTIHRLAIKSGYAEGMANLPALIWWEMGLLFWLLRKGKSFDVIHACDFDTILPALCCKWLYKKKIVYDIFDFYADHLRRTPELIKDWIRILDYFAVRSADSVIIVDDSRREQIKPANPNQVTVIYNSPGDVFPQLQGRRDQLGENLRLVYVGLLQVERGLLELLQVLNSHPSWHLDIAGFGGDQKVIMEAAQQIENIKWHGRIPYQKTLKLTAGCDVSIATYDPSIENHRYASPNKIFEAMMLSKPVIVAHKTNMDEIIRRWNCGLVVDYGDPVDLERAIIRLDKNPSLRRELGKNGRQAYQREYSWVKMEKRLIHLYRSL